MRFCPECNSEVFEDSIKCLNCGVELRKVSELSGTCSICKNQKVKTILVQDFEICETCLRKKISSVSVTTTPSIDGYKIDKYIDIESVEIVIGTGVFSEFSTDFQDAFGLRSTAFEKKLQSARSTAIERLKFLAISKKANAIVGVDIDYTEFSGNRIGVIATGTLVEITR